LDGWAEVVKTKPLAAKPATHVHVGAPVLSTLAWLLAGHGATLQLPEPPVKAGPALASHVSTMSDAVYS
jgi:hypothetical protein